MYSGPFISYVEQCSGPVYKLVDYGHEDIRRAALSALTQFAICIGKQPNGDQGISPFSYLFFFCLRDYKYFINCFVACSSALVVLIPKLSEAIHTDSEINVVNEALDCLTELLKELKGLTLKVEGHLDAILMCIKNVFNKAVKENFKHFEFSRSFQTIFSSSVVGDNRPSVR